MEPKTWEELLAEIKERYYARIAAGEDFVEEEIPQRPPRIDNEDTQLFALKNSQGQYVFADIEYSTSSMGFTPHLSKASLGKFETEPTVDQLLHKVSGPSRSCEDFCERFKNQLKVVRVNLSEGDARCNN